jgi:2-phosphosulfolactate phosphatase
MKIVRKSCLKGAREARGLVVIIDVFRAFSCEPLLFHFGVKRVILEADPEKALLLKRKIPGAILVGEINEEPIEGAELGNSPSHIIQKGKSYFSGKTIVHRTTAGVVGVKCAFERSEEILLGSFLMASAICRYIKRKSPLVVTLVAMGERGERPGPEDESCADYIEHLISGSRYDSVEEYKKVVFQPTAQKFIKGEKEYLPREDPIFCLQRDLFEFVLTVRKVDGQLEVFKALP